MLSCSSRLTAFLSLGDQILIELLYRSSMTVQSHFAVSTGVVGCWNGGDRERDVGSGEEGGHLVSGGGGRSSRTKCYSATSEHQLPCPRTGPLLFNCDILHRGYDTGPATNNVSVIEAPVLRLQTTARLLKCRCSRRIHPPARRMGLHQPVTARRAQRMPHAYHVLEQHTALPLYCLV